MYSKGYYEKLSAKKAKGLNEVLHQRYPNLNEASSFEKEIILFDLRDLIINFLEKKGYFEPSKTPISLMIKIENFVHDLIQQSLHKAHDVQNKEEMGFGNP